MKLEIDHADQHQQAEGHQQDPADRSDRPSQHLELGADLNGHVDLVGSWKEPGQRQTGDEALVAHPAPLFHNHVLRWLQADIPPPNDDRAT